ncbi:dihydrolipoyl dehydrogenase family protein [Actinorugispora endophytica]|uniref:Pyruvate/2-oxoglutarate dehydrogenase complex dihydrolipoamide dehydrogenase (E3) component n=1 Tax=Actinorugispora endophytica TaxID=1605990 RepID=A0A4R6UU90_9ACTN|nr:NAD(P)/FAD-dependent oxidoreductase [Actinorugispora endophytica]TDQ50722.1 pyruvate/2-oxoglutarate dehydrogenase complex dihydrolipoamide dehydrogenase (E3) component [Actinorugispora endophytica]
MVESVDVVVIGMGPGGEALAGELAEAGLSVVGVEAGLVGGECPYWGCVPSKMMVRAADALAEARRVPALAGGADVRPDWAPVTRRIRDEATSGWDDKAAADRFVAKGGRLVRGRGRITGADTVGVTGDREYGFKARRAIVVATGTTPSVPPIPGLADIPYWTNHEAIEAAEVPESLCVIGGGAVGLELAQVYARFGARVTVLEAADRLLGTEEPEAGLLLAGVLEEEGVTVRTNARIDRVHRYDGGFAVNADRGPVRARRVLVATGRRARLRDLGVGEIGLDPDARAVEVDDRMRVAPGVWAVGDVTGKGPFTHVAIYQAGIAAADILGREVEGARYHALPRVTFTDPEIGAVGLTEAQARRKGVNARVGTTRVPSSTRGWIHGTGNDGFVKLVEDADTGVLVGATSAGPCGGEVLGALAVAVHAGVPTGRLRSMIYAYPTFHRAISEALDALDGSGRAPGEP